MSDLLEEITNIISASTKVPTSILTKDIDSEEFKKNLNTAMIYDFKMIGENKMKVVITPNTPLEIDIPDDNLDAIYDRGVNDFRDKLIQVIDMNHITAQDIIRMADELKKHNEE